MLAAQLLEKRLPGEPAARLHQRRVVVDRMGAEIGADRRRTRAAGAPPAARDRPRRGRAAPARRRRRRDRRCRSRRARRAPAPRRRFCRCSRRPWRAAARAQSKAPACDQAFQRLAVDDLRIDARGEIGEVCEGPRAARRDEVLDHLRADALQRGERVDDPAVGDLEGDAGAVDVGRQRPRCRAGAPPGGIRSACRCCPCRASSTRRGTRPGSSPSDRRSGRRPARRRRRATC